MKEIPLTKGYVALVDDEDYGRLVQVKWQTNRDGYAIAKNNAEFVRLFGRGWPSSPLMHRVILGDPRGPEIDHKDRCVTNNQKRNFRPANKSQNQMNSKSRPGTSAFKGVSWQPRDHHWRATIMLDGRQTYLGKYSTEADAARAYDRAALRMFGEFARTNFPESAPSHTDAWRAPVKSSTGYLGVTLGGRGFATSHLQGSKRIHLGVFDTAYDAALYRDYYLNKNNLPGRRNFEL